MMCEKNTLEFVWNHEKMQKYKSFVMAGRYIKNKVICKIA